MDWAGEGVWWSAIAGRFCRQRNWGGGWIFRGSQYGRMGDQSEVTLKGLVGPGSLNETLSVTGCLMAPQLGAAWIVDGGPICGL